MSKVYRFNLSKHIKDQLVHFIDIHKYDDLATYKLEWDEYVKKNKELFDNEIEYLQGKGYKGDVMNKIYKSARYYWRKKNDDTNKPSLQLDKVSLRFDRDFINKVSQHIERNINRLDYKPATGFTDFIELYADDIDELRKTLETRISYDNLIKKIKKTYKNRYYIISRNLK